MAKLKWELQPNRRRWKLISLAESQSLVEVWQSLNDYWIGEPFGDPIDSIGKYLDAETAKCAMEDKLIGRCQVALAALEALRAKGRTEVVAHG